MPDVSVSEKSGTQNVSCIIFDVDENSTLDTIRDRIEKETEELLKGDYRFFVSGVHLGLAQEQTVLVSEAITWERGEPVIKYQLWYEEINEHILMATNDAQQLENVDIKEQGQCTSQKTAAQRSPFSLLKSPTTCSIKGIKLYSDKDIETSVGKGKERRIFWNRRAKQLCKEETKKADLYKRIHED